MTEDRLYPDILFHFTNKESLFSILKKTFKISYAREIILGRDVKREFAVPMVSFCDLRLSELKNHINKYGSYGIGLSKKWANYHGISPVMYINRHSYIADNLNNGLNGIYNHLNKLKDASKLDTLDKSYRNILKTYQFIKNYEGHLIRKGNLINENYRFAEEREWRYVPSLEETGVEPFIAKTNIDTDAKKQKYNDRISDISLHFQPNDIRYLIVKNPDEIEGLINHLNEVKGMFQDITRNKLISKILTVKQIHDDF